MKRQLSIIVVAMVAMLGCNTESTPVSSENAAFQDSHLATIPLTNRAPTIFGATLSGDEAGTTSRARGVARFGVTPDGETVVFQLIVSNIQNVTQAHIHISDVPGGNGPPAVWLYPDAPPAVEIPGRFSGVLARGSFSASDFVGGLAGLTVEDLISRIEENRAYVNVHTTQNPPGEIRGQLR